MTEVLGGLAELLGRLVGWLLRRETVTTFVELLGGTSIVVGLAGISLDVALVALGVMLLATSWRWNAKNEE